MQFYNSFKKSLTLACALALTTTSIAAISQDQEPKIPRFSIEHMDKTVDPSVDFYNYANGNWAKNNPIPNDQSIWRSFNELVASFPIRIDQRAYLRVKFVFVLKKELLV